MTYPLRFGLKNSGQDTTIADLRAVWRIADESGFDHVWDFDHLAAIGGGGPDRPIYEGWTLQAAMAEATKRVRIGCLVTGNTYRNPALLAKEAVTVDHLSGGRLEFGIGAAWAEIEHEMYGFEGLDHRVGRLSESLRVIKSLFTEERTTFEGRYYHFKDAIANPKPIQKPHPPFWIGASGPSTLRLVARYGDVWNIAGGDPDQVKELIPKFEEACGSRPRRLGDPALDPVRLGRRERHTAAGAVGAIPRAWGDRAGHLPAGGITGGAGGKDRASASGPAQARPRENGDLGTQSAH